MATNLHSAPSASAQDARTPAPSHLDLGNAASPIPPDTTGGYAEGAAGACLLANRIGLRPAEVAQVLGISTYLVRKLINSGRLPASRLGLDGRACVVAVSDVRALLRESA